MSLWERLWVPPMATLSLWWQWRGSQQLLTQIYGPDLRLALVKELNHFADLLGERKFFGGEEANVLDVYLYGTLCSVADEQTGESALSQVHPRFLAWYQRTQQIVLHQERNT